MRETALCLGIALSALALVGCGTVRNISEYKKAFESNGYHAYIPPKGDPDSPWVRDHFGAGSIIRLQDGSCLLSAPKIISDKELLAHLRTNSIDTVLFNGTKVSGGSLALEANLVSPEVLKAGFSVTGTNQQQQAIRFGPTKSCPLVEDDAINAWLSNRSNIRQTFRNQVVQGRAGLVVDIIWAKSLLFRYEKSALQKFETKGELKTGDSVKINGQNFTVVGSDLSFDSPMIIGYKVSRDVRAEERQQSNRPQRVGRVSVASAPR